MKLGSLAILMALFFCCCHKSGTSNNNNNNNSDTLKYTTVYDSVIETYANRNLTFSFSVNVLSGNIDNNPITYSIGNVPTGVTITPATQVVSNLLGGTFDISTGNITTGNYNLTVGSSTAKSGTKARNLLVKVLPLPDYSSQLAGSYPGSYDFCTPESIFYHYTSVVTKVTGTPYQIKISNVKNLGAGLSVNATLSNIITVPFQTIGTYKIWGTGSFTHDNPPHDSQFQMTIFDTMVNGLDTQHCTMHIQH